MKKIILSFAIVLLLITALPVSAERIGEVPKVTDHEKVTIHLFYASWCHNCHNFLKYMSNKYEDYSDYFEIKTYLVSSAVGEQRITIDENNKIFESVATAFNKEAAFPLIIIGDEFAQLGYSDVYGPTIIEKALEEYQNPDYKDKVNEIIKKDKLDTSKIGNFIEACEASGVNCNNGADYSAYILIGIFVVVVAGLGALVVAGKKK